MTRYVCIYITVFSILLIPLHSHARMDSAYFKSLGSSGLPNMYTIQDHPNQKLIEVRLLSGVKNPGIYRVPVETGLVSLLSWSGGFNQQANPEKITIARANGQSIDSIDINDVLSDVRKNDLKLKSKDIVYIDAKKDLVGKDTILITTLIATAMGIVLTGIAIGRETKN
jgi:hypothetical protein